MGTAAYDFDVKQGARFDVVLTWYNPLPNTDPPEPDLASPINLTGWHARLQVRSHASDPEPLVSLDDGALGGLVLGGVAGTVSVALTAIQTALLPVRGAAYDLFLTPPSGMADDEKLIRGRVLVEERIST